MRWLGVRAGGGGLAGSGGGAGSGAAEPAVVLGGPGALCDAGNFTNQGGVLTVFSM